MGLFEETDSMENWKKLSTHGLPYLKSIKKISNDLVELYVGESKLHEGKNMSVILSQISEVLSTARLNVGDHKDTLTI